MIGKILGYWGILCVLGIGMELARTNLFNVISGFMGYLVVIRLYEENAKEYSRFLVPETRYKDVELKEISKDISVFQT